MIAFRLEQVGDGQYRVEAANDESEVFASFVNGDLFGTEGVVELLERVRRVRAGEEAPYSETRNAHELSVDPAGVSIVNDYTGATAHSTTDELVTFLEDILAALASA
jgi:hypothetical protein